MSTFYYTTFNLHGCTAGKVWLALLVSVTVWSVTLWLLQTAWKWQSGGDTAHLGATLLYCWGALLERPPVVPTIKTSGKASPLSRTEQIMIKIQT